MVKSAQERSSLELGVRYLMSGKDSGASVEVENLRREFDSKQNKVVALDGVNLQVRQGDIFGVLGPNGAGKTT